MKYALTTLNIIVPLLFVNFVSQSLAQRPGFVPPEWARKRFFSVSTQSPMLHHMAKQTNFNSSASIIIDYITSAENHMIDALRNQSDPRPEMLFRPCSISNERFKNSVATSFAMRGLPEIKYDCISDIVDTKYFADEPPSMSVHTVYSAAMDYFELISRERRTISENILRNWSPFRTIGANWTEPSESSRLPYVEDNIKCQGSLISASRVGKRWYISLGITNAPPLHTPPHLMRQILFESIYINERHHVAEALKKIIPSYTPAEDEGPPVQGTTTVLTRWKGRKGLGGFFAVPPRKTPAMWRPRWKARIPAEQAASSLVLSSILIFLLPAILNLIPLALIVRTNRKLLFLTILTDIVTVLPMTIKGRELIVIGQQRFRSVAVRVHRDMRGILGKGAAGEFWAVECRVKNDVVSAGIGLVCAGLGLVVFGIWLEVWGMGFIRRREEKRMRLEREYMKVGADEDYDDEAYMMSLSSMSKQDSKPAV